MTRSSACMLDAKVKLKDLRTGQEYLLLVAKMNLKGLLVRSSQPIAPDAPLRLALQLSDSQSPLTLRGEVHKIAQHPSGSRGVIVRFLNPSSKDLARIGAYLERFEVKTTPPSREKTAIGDIASISKLSLKSPDREAGFVVSTADEEAVHAARPGLGGETRVFDIEDVRSRGRTRPGRGPVRSAFKIVAFAGGFILAAMIFFRPVLRYLDERFGLRPPSPSIDISPLTSHPPEKPVTVPGPESSPGTEEGDLDEPPSPPKARGEITAYQVEDSGSYLKVSVRGVGDFSKYLASRAQSPKRLIIDLPSVRSFKVKESVLVGKNPLLRIKAKPEGGGIRIVFDLYPVNFPRYHIKTYADSIDVFFQR